MIFAREYYLNKIRGFYDSDVIKVITGIRRCGKSFFMLSVMEDLKKRGTSERDIVYINLDKKGFTNITTPDALETVVDNAIVSEGKKYIFIDEVQNVTGFEPVVNAYREEGHSVFITGSNSYLLSGELATKLTGRYIEIEMFTLSFSEYLQMKKFYGKTIDDRAVEFNKYMRDGGFPQTLEFNKDEDKALYVQNVIEQIFKKDIASKKKIKNRDLFERVKTYIINNFGCTTSLTNICNEFAKQGISMKRETIAKYIELLENAKIIYRCSRFDIKSKKSLRGEEKYYLADLGIYFATNVDGRINYGPVLENILYCYLRAKGYKLSVGRIGNLECDFITRKRDIYTYIQVAMTIAERTTEDREYRPFEMIRDNYPKYLFTLDPLLQNRDGIIHKNLVEFIDKDEEL